MFPVSKRAYEEYLQKKLAIFLFLSNLSQCIVKILGAYGYRRRSLNHELSVFRTLGKRGVKIKVKIFERA